MAERSYWYAHAVQEARAQGRSRASTIAYTVIPGLRDPQIAVAPLARMISMRDEQARLTAARISPVLAAVPIFSVAAPDRILTFRDLFTMTELQTAPKHMSRGKYCDKAAVSWKWLFTGAQLCKIAFYSNAATCSRQELLNGTGITFCSRCCQRQAS